ncbi:Proton-coupled folate transporter [Exaiptasia diaphana]|nr:Proton-coupled folate transporter [Exaiptasia diaphana]
MGFVWKQFSYVEPVFFVYMHYLLLLFPVMAQYVYARISEDVGFPYLNVTGGERCGGEDFAENSTLKTLETEVQTRSATLYTYYMVCAVIPSLIVGPFYGSYSDKRGRKPVLMAPLLAGLFETCLILVIIYFHLPLYMLFIGGVVNGLSGYVTTLWLALNSYLADTVKKDKLSNRMIVLNFSLFLAGTIAQLTSGLWIEYLGFKNPLWFIVSLQSLACLYTILFVKESVKEKVKANFFDLNSVRRLLQIVTKPRKNGRKNLVVALSILGTNIMITVGLSAVIILYVLRSPLCWQPTLVGYFLAYRFFALGAGSVIFIYLLRKCFNEINVTRLGFVSQIAGMLLFAFSTKTWMVFLANP